MKIKFPKKLYRCITAAVLSIFVLGIFCTILNIYIVSDTKDYIISSDEAADLDDIDCVIVLGCLVKPGGIPSDMLYDRLAVGSDLYLSGAAPKLLMSGDHGRTDYDEVNAMKKFAADAGIPEEDIFTDHAGFSTYDSIYRARDIFEAKRVIIVTQEYHLYRALYIAESLGLTAYGVPADLRDYGGQTMRDIREVAARIKDFFMAAFKAKPTVLGDAIPISGDASLSDG